MLAVHVPLCVLTSCAMLSDAARPPSARKKRHLLLKWASGGFLLAAAVAHMLMAEKSARPECDPAFLLATLLVSGILAWHLSVGVKSLLKDLGLDRTYRNGLRLIVCVCCALAAAAAAWRFAGAL